MTLRFAFALAGIVAAFPAAASSIVALPAPAEGPSPSIVHLGASPASPSSVAVGVPAVEDIRVSSIGEEKPQAVEQQKAKTSFRSRTPMVIRGGMVGEAFAVRASPTPAPVVQASQQKSTAEAARQEAPAEPAASPQEAMPDAPSGGLEAVR